MVDWSSCWIEAAFLEGPKARERRTQKALNLSELKVSLARFVVAAEGLFFSTGLLACFFGFFWCSLLVHTQGAFNLSDLDVSLACFVVFAVGLVWSTTLLTGSKPPSLKALTPEKGTLSGSLIVQAWTALLLVSLFSPGT